MKIKLANNTFRTAPITKKITSLEIFRAIINQVAVMVRQMIMSTISKYLFLMDISHTYAVGEYIVYFSASLSNHLDQIHKDY